MLDDSTLATEQATHRLRETSRGLRVRARGPFQTEVPDIELQFVVLEDDVQPKVKSGLAGYVRDCVRMRLVEFRLDGEQGELAGQARQDLLELRHGGRLDMDRVSGRHSRIPLSRDALPTGPGLSRGKSTQPTAPVNAGVAATSKPRANRLVRQWLDLESE